MASGSTFKCTSDYTQSYKWISHKYNVLIIMLFHFAELACRSGHESEPLYLVIG